MRSERTCRITEGFYCRRDEDEIGRIWYNSRCFIPQEKKIRSVLNEKSSGSGVRAYGGIFASREP
jgi:hypothetical protein